MEIARTSQSVRLGLVSVEVAIGCSLVVAVTVMAAKRPPFLVSARAASTTVQAVVINGFDAYSQLPAANRAQGTANIATWRAALERPVPIDMIATDARSIQKSTLLVAGEGSAPPLRAVIQRLAELIPTAEVKEIPGASHGMNFQNPVALDAAILAFLEKHPSA